MDENEAAYVRKAVLEAAEKQVADGDPPETAETLARLPGDGYPRDEAVLMIGHVLGVEVFGIMNEGREYVHAAYVRAVADSPPPA